MLGQTAKNLGLGANLRAFDFQSFGHSDGGLPECFGQGRLKGQFQIAKDARGRGDAQTDSPELTMWAKTWSTVHSEKAIFSIGLIGFESAVDPTTVTSGKRATSLGLSPTRTRCTASRRRSACASDSSAIS